MESLADVYGTLQLKEFGTCIDIDFGDEERYIPWRPQCPIKFNGAVTKSIQKHVGTKRSLRVLGWHHPAAAPTNTYYPIGKFACTVCQKDNYLNPVHDNIAYVFQAADPSHDKRHHIGLICKSCITYFPESGHPLPVSMTMAPDHAAKAKAAKASR